MESFWQLWDEWRPTLEEWLAQPWFWGVVGLVLVVLIVLLSRRRSGRRKQQTTGPIVPALEFQGFQIAPLGRDAFFTIRSPRAAVTLSELRINGRRDIVVKRHPAGHQIEPGGAYSVLLEANGDQLIRPDFTVEIIYLDAAAASYSQQFDPAQGLSQPPKLLKRATN